MLTLPVIWALGSQISPPCAFWEHLYNIALESVLERVRPRDVWESESLDVRGLSRGEEGDEGM